MSKRLSKISRELHIGISSIVDFLNTNGYDCEEDPTLEIQEDVIDFLKNNILQTYTSNTTSSEYKKDESENIQENSEKSDVPLELKILEEANKYTKLIEKVIGFTDFDWHYTVVSFTGTCSQPIDFTLFDEVICEMLLIRQMSEQEIGRVLGFDIETDPAEKHLLDSAIQELKKDDVIEGEESLYRLSNVGVEYARKGVKFSTFTRNFNLYIDAIAGLKGDTKKIFSKLRSEKQQIFRHDNLPQNLEDVKELAEVQAPEIHFPEKNYILQSCQPTGVEGFIAKVWVILLENFRDKTNRVLVYDDVSGKIIETLSDAISQMENQKQLILEKLLSDSNSGDFVVEKTSEEKSNEQIKQEEELIQQQAIFDQAAETQNQGTIRTIQQNIKYSKRHFNSLDFEVELKRLFDDTNGELWIISPWIKNATLKRIPFFKQYMQKGGKIFVAYSLPEDGISNMALSDPYEKLMELDKQYNNFYIHQLAPFHYKRVWLLNNGKGTLYYTGSYNILSFFVQPGYTNIRQEEMTKLDWDEEEDKVYRDIFVEFGKKYFDLVSNEFNNLCKNVPSPIDKAFLQKLKAFNFGKLRTFVGRGLEPIDEMFKQIEDAKESYLQYFKGQYGNKELLDINKEALEIGSSIVSVEKKRALQSRFNILINEFPDIENVEKVKELIRNIKTPKFDKKFKNKVRNRW